MTLQATTKSLIEVKDYLDRLLQIASYDEDDNGLIVGGRPMVTRIGLAVNCSFQAIDGAAQRSCDLLFTHHAALASTDAHLVEQKYQRIRQLGVNLYAAHASLDCARGFGTADALARAVRVAIQGSFAPDGKQEFGLHGMAVGSFGEFATRVGNQLGVEPRAWKNTSSFGHIGLVAGWGGRPEGMARAQALGCDTFLTGEASMFGILFAKEAGMNLVLTGHYTSKVPGVMGISARIARDLELDVTFIPEEIVEAKR
jgi:putative NIF3 family GTP cyclohydrolase 1 type 2